MAFSTPLPGLKPLAAVIALVSSQQAYAICTNTFSVTDTVSLDAAIAALNDMECADQTVTWNVGAGLTINTNARGTFDIHDLIINGDANNPPTIVSVHENGLLQLYGGSEPFAALTINNVIIDGGSGGQFDSIVNTAESGSVTLNNVEINNADYRALSASNSTVRINDSKFSGNQTTNGSGGGAMYLSNSSDVEIKNSTFKNNTVGGNIRGGAVSIFHSDFLIEDSIFEDNTTENDENDANFGGAIAATAENAMSGRIVGSEFRGNVANSYGGAMYVNGFESIEIEDTIFENNEVKVLTNEFGSGSTAEAHGGALAVGRSTALTITDSEFSENQADALGGAVFIGDGSFTASETVDVVINSTSFFDNASVEPEINTSTDHHGGALYVKAQTVESSPSDYPSTHVKIQQSLFSGNSSLGTGGAVQMTSGNITEIENSTFDANQALDSGSAILLYGAGQSGSSIKHSTFTDNTLTENPLPTYATPIGLDNVNSATFEISHTIIAGNDFNQAQVNVSESSFGAEFSYSFLDDQTNTTSTAYVLDGTSLVGGDGLAVLNPELHALADNGGSTLTRYPQDGSLVINAGNASIADAPEQDQRGSSRVVETIDIGAVEYGNLQPDVVRTSVTLEEDKSFSFDLTDYVSDPEALSMTFTVTEKPSWLSISGTQVSGTAGDPGTYTLKVTATDSVGWSVDATINITVEKKSSKKGGALGGLFALIAGGLLFRRRS